MRLLQLLVFIIILLFVFGCSPYLPATLTWTHNGDSTDICLAESTTGIVSDTTAFINKYYKGRQSEFYYKFKTKKNDKYIIVVARSISLPDTSNWVIEALKKN